MTQILEDDAIDTDGKPDLLTLGLCHCKQMGILRIKQIVCAMVNRVSVMVASKKKRLTKGPASGKTIGESGSIKLPDTLVTIRQTQ